MRRMRKVLCFITWTMLSYGRRKAEAVCRRQNENFGLRLLGVAVLVAALFVRRLFGSHFAGGDGTIRRRSRRHRLHRPSAKQAVRDITFDTVNSTFRRISRLCGRC